MRSLLPLALVGAALLAPNAPAQFVYPRAEDNRPKPGLYREDPFIVAYRKRFFAVFRGDFKTFQTACDEIKALVKKDPKDARALVWLGNGQTIEAGLLKVRGEKAEAEALLATSRRTLDRAVALKPDDPSIYMMRAATLYVQGQYWAEEEIPKVVWERLRDDTRKFVAFLGPDRVRRVSVHVRGEAFGEMGVALAKLGDKEGAKAAFKRVIELCPGTRYEERARREIAALESQV